MTSIDQQGSLRLTQSLIGLSKSSYWLSIRLTLYDYSIQYPSAHVQIITLNKNPIIQYLPIDNIELPEIEHNSGKLRQRYIAAKQPLNPYTTYEFNVEAFTIAHRNDILFEIIPMISINKILLTTIDSTINIDLLTTTEIGSPILQLGLNNRFNNTNVYYDWS
ncbi:unnamed protein product [Rotaria sordida]|uniref:Uncharacterized protein n=1 Tax=Rotaria sordida TaxID=392033 RepID=A0A819UWH0_9BILA|nr:unnamed protein product [Rotaria sordida]